MSNRTSTKAEIWEVFILALEDRAALDRAAEGLRAEGQPPSLNSDLIRIVGCLRIVRSKLADRVRSLRRFVSGLPIGRYSAETMEFAFGLILASPEGNLRIDQWLEDPVRHRREAAIRVEGVVGRAQKYLQALAGGPAS